MKKNKNFKTKPAYSCKRLSKVALELGDVSSQTEMNAQMEWQGFRDDKKNEIDKKNSLTGKLGLKRTVKNRGQ